MEIDQILEKIEGELKEIHDVLESEPREKAQEKLASCIEALEKQSQALSNEPPSKPYDAKKINQRIDHRILKTIFQIQNEEPFKQKLNNLGNVALALWKAVDHCEQEVKLLKKRVRVERGGPVDQEGMR